jgi:pyruvate/2-oxoacid:ferredoxin oxidoreductase alpha subunit
MGVIVLADWYPDFELINHDALKNSIRTIKDVNREFGDRFGRYYDVIEPYRTSDADIIFIGMGSHISTARWVVDRLREQNEKVGLVNLRVFRPFPTEELLEACGNAKALAVLDRSVGYGTSGLVYPDITRVFYNIQDRPNSLDFIIGLGGKDISPETIIKCYDHTVKALDTNDFSQDIIWPDARSDKEVD